MTVVSAVPTTYTTPSSYATYVHPYQQNDIHVSCGYPCAYFQGNQDNPYYTIYYVNNMPYACYVHQPDILYPLQFVSDPPGQNNERVLPELVSAMTDAAGEVLQQQVSSLENYVQNMEQQAVSTVEQKVRKSCLSCIM
jgi:hypothetical protein